MILKKKPLAMLALILSLTMSVSLFAGCSKDDTEPTSSEGSIKEYTDTAAATVTVKENVEILNFIAPEIGEKIAVITVKDFGEIKIKLFPDAAPKAVENFIGLAEMGYYDELIFHRIIEGFMNQGGDPKGNGTGGKSIWGEKFEGGIAEGLYHFSGAIAYANSGSTSTNGSQFYIVNTPADEIYYGGTSTELYTDFSKLTTPKNAQEKYLEVGGVPFLDGGYTVFGQVFEGMDVVIAMSKVEVDGNDKPLSQVKMESVKIVEYQG